MQDIPLYTITQHSTSQELSTNWSVQTHDHHRTAKHGRGPRDLHSFKVCYHYVYIQYPSVHTQYPSVHTQYPSVHTQYPSVHTQYSSVHTTLRRVLLFEITKISINATDYFLEAREKLLESQIVAG